MLSSSKEDILRFFTLNAEFFAAPFKDRDFQLWCEKEANSAVDTNFNIKIFSDELLKLLTYDTTREEPMLLLYAQAVSGYKFNELEDLLSVKRPQRITNTLLKGNTDLLKRVIDAIHDDLYELIRECMQYPSTLDVINRWYKQQPGNVFQKRLDRLPCFFQQTFDNLFEELNKNQSLLTYRVLVANLMHWQAHTSSRLTNPEVKDKFNEWLQQHTKSPCKSETSKKRLYCLLLANHELMSAFINRCEPLSSLANDVEKGIANFIEIVGRDECVASFGEFQPSILKEKYLLKALLAMQYIQQAPMNDLVAKFVTALHYHLDDFEKNTKHFCSSAEIDIAQEFAKLSIDVNFVENEQEEQALLDRYSALIAKKQAEHDKRISSNEFKSSQAPVIGKIGSPGPYTAPPKRTS